MTVHVWSLAYSPSTCCAALEFFEHLLTTSILESVVLCTKTTEVLEEPVARALTKRYNEPLDLPVDADREERLTVGNKGGEDSDDIGEFRGAILHAYSQLCTTSHFQSLTT